MTTKKNIYALLVGINEYLSPNISNLNGTQKDLQDVHEYILSHYDGYEKNIETLKDTQATRANIVKGFEQHLGQAQEGDIVLFYYSGHGSWGKTNEAFFKFDPDHREEVVVSHDSRVNGQFDLADKEIAVLLNYVARNNPEVVLLIDSCHSGSLTRFSDATTRLTGGSEKDRQLSDYLYDSTLEEHKNYYTNLYKANGGEIPALPMSRHLLMSACSERELARETKDGGWFTQSLLKVLKEQPESSYFQVYSQVFSTISQKYEKQTPQLEAYGLFNANNAFLTGERNLSKGTRFRIGRSEKNNALRVDFGAQTGFPLDISRAINFNIYKEKYSTEPIGVGQVNSIGLVDSEMRVSFKNPSREMVYWGEILDYALAPVMICFEGADKDLELLNAALAKRDLQQVVFVSNDAVAPFILAWDDKDACYRLTERQQEQVWNANTEKYERQSFNRPVFILELGKQDLQDAFKVDTVIDTLEHLCQWKYTTELDNPKSRINKKAIEVTFTTDSPADAHKVKAVVKANQGSAEYGLEDANEGKLDYGKLILDYTEEEPINYSIRIKNNTSDTAYLALALITADYGVIPLQSNIILGAGEVLEEAVDKFYGSLSIQRKKDTNITNYLKVFISKKEISTIQGLELPSLALEEQLQFFESTGDRSFGAKANLNDWCSKTIAFNLKRDVNSISEQKVEIDRRGIFIHGHDRLKANVQVNSPERNTRSANQLFETLPNQVPNFELFYMDDGTGFPSEAVLELTNIEHEEELAENPLKISVPKLDDEMVFPFTTETILVKQEDGSYLEETIILPIGVNAGTDADGNDLYEISELPTHSNKGTRSLGKALKMCFGKLFLSKDNYNLCWVDYENGGQRESEGVAEKVSTAKKILVILHGIIGDTGAMATNMEFTTSYYDLVLTYDYENLNTPIEKISEQFQKQLTEVGITADADKTVDLVAHSMGGLVSRTFIESSALNGDSIVRNLYMLGTPNAGSAFAKVAAYRDLLSSAIGFALNFKTFGLSSLIQKVKGLSVTKNLTVTLEQMGTTSDFIKNLNGGHVQKPEGIQYYILAGLTTNYKDTVVGKAAKLISWATMKVGSVAYGETENDIAVSTESILGVPARFVPITQRVDCHHMVYFVHEPTMKLLEGWMKANDKN